MALSIKRHLGIPKVLALGEENPSNGGGSPQTPPLVEYPINFSPANGPVGTRFLFALGITTGNPDPVPTYKLLFNDIEVSLDEGGGYTPEEAGTLEWSAVWTNGVSPDAVETVTGEVYTPVPVLGPLDHIWDETGQESLSVRYDLASNIAVLGVAFKYDGNLVSVEAKHGDDVLTMAGFTYDGLDKIASVMFIGNGLVIEPADLVITPIGGATIGPAVARINDDYGYTEIATDWNSGTFGNAQSLTGILTVSGISGQGRLSYATASTNTDNTPKALPTNKYIDLFWAFAMAGTKEDAPLFETTYANWIQDGTKWTHTGDPSYLTGLTLPSLQGPNIGYEIENAVIGQGSHVHIYVYPETGSDFLYASFFGPYTGNLRKIVGRSGFKPGYIRLLAVGDVEFDGATYIDNPEFVLGDFGRSIDTAINGDRLQVSYTYPTAYTLTAIEVHDEG